MPEALVSLISYLKVFIERKGAAHDVNGLHEHEHYAYVAADFHPITEKANVNEEEDNEERQDYQELAYPEPIVDDGAALSAREDHQENEQMKHK